MPDPELRISLEGMKEHQIFKVSFVLVFISFQDFDFDCPMRDRFINGIAPFIPPEPVFNEKAERDSAVQEPIKPKNLLAAIMGNPMLDGKAGPEQPKMMDFDEAHYDKF